MLHMGKRALFVCGVPNSNTENIENQEIVRIQKAKSAVADPETSGGGGQET